MTSTFLGYKLYSSNAAQSLQRVAKEPQNASDQKYFEANINKVTSVDQFLGNYRLFTYAMKAYGLSDLGNAKALMKQVLESDLTDSTSVANRLNDSRYRAFAKAFNFSTSGAVKSAGQLQTNDQREDLMSRIDPLYSETGGFESQLSAVTSVASLESNSTLYTRVLEAYGINPDPKVTNKADVTRALESDLSDPNSFVNRADLTTTTKNADGTTTTTTTTNYAKFRAMRMDFNFMADGSIGSQSQLQSAANIVSAQTAYMSATTATTTAKTASLPADQAATAQAAAKQAAATESAYYAQKVPGLTSVAQLVADPRLFAFVKTAYGLDANMSTTQMKAVLSSNLLDPKSLANTFNVQTTTTSTSTTSSTSSTGSTSSTSSTSTASTSTTKTPTPYQLLAAAFNVGTDGSAWDHSQVISATSLTTTTGAYTAAVAATAANQDTKTAAATVVAGQKETDYFNTKITGVASVSALLSDTRLVAYVRKAFNFPDVTTTTNADGSTTTTGTSAADLGKILSSDILDTTSPANTSGTSARSLALAFNFAPNGFVYSERPIMSSTDFSAMATAYASQAGTSTSAKAAAQTETNYFTSMLPRLKSVDDLLNDKRLVAYVSKAYNLSTTQTVTQKNILRQVLTSNVLDPKSKANVLGGGYQTLAGAFAVAADGSIAHAPDKVAQNKAGIVATHSAYLEQVMEQEAGDQDGDGVRLALYFKRVAPTITSAYGILADKALTSVVQTMLGLPATASNADIDSQARFISSKINIADFKNPQKLDKLIARFTTLYDLTNTSSSS